MYTNILIPAIGVEIYKKISNLWHNDLPNIKLKVYVIGNGWGAYHFVKTLDKRKYYPIIIAPNSKVLDTTKLTKLVIKPNIKVELENPYYAEYIKDMVEDIDYSNKKIILKSGTKLDYKYNYIVMSIGSEPNDFNIPGVESHTYKLRTISDANVLREKINSLLINSQINIIGSGVSGIELGTNLNYLGNKIKIIEGLDSILYGYNSNTKQKILSKIESLYPNININLNTMVMSINKSNELTKELRTLNKKNDTLSSTLLDNSSIIIWTGGVRFNGYNKTTLFNTLNQITPIKPRGLDVNLDFTIGNHSNIYCIGDMVANAGPSSAQNAKLQAEWLGKYFNSEFDKKYVETNKFESNITTKLVHLNQYIWLESKYYSGFIPRFMDKIIGWTNK